MQEKKNHPRCRDGGKIELKLLKPRLCREDKLSFTHFILQEWKPTQKNPSRVPKNALHPTLAANQHHKQTQRERQDLGSTGNQLFLQQGWFYSHEGGFTAASQAASRTLQCFLPRRFNCRLINNSFHPPANP